MEPPLVEVDDGWDFKVLVVAGEWVVRWPRHRLAVEEIEKEVALLPALAPLLPVAVPRFEYVSREPWLVAYRLIDGEPLTDEDPGGVRAFLEALHAVDVDAVPAPRPDWLEIYREHAEEWRRIVVPLLQTGERKRAEGLLAEIETLSGFEPALVHCDLGPSHLRVRDGRLAGVIDWGDAKIGDPAIDYSWLLNVRFPDWDVDEELRRRALIYHRLGPWFEVHYGVFTEQLALISDQHGNDIAFRAVADVLELIGVADIVCLGDVAQGGDEPAQTLDRLAALGCDTVLGNADAFLLEVPTDSNEEVTEQQLERREWTLSQLDDSHLEQIRSFAPMVQREIEGVRMRFFHGSPRFYEDVLLPESGEDALAPFLGHDAALLAGGHTHLQWTRRIGDALYVNPGSVGLSWDRHSDPPVPRSLAEWALVTVGDGAVAVEFRQVAY